MSVRFAALLCGFLVCTWGSLAGATPLVVQTVDDDGTWIEDVLVSVDGGGVSGRTGTAGVWEGDLPPGSYTIVARHPAYDEVRREISIADDVVQTRLVMKETYVGFSVTFHVQCVFSSVDLRNAEVVLERSDSLGGAVVDTVRANTDDQGEVVIPGLETGYYRISVNMLEWEPVTFPDGDPMLLSAGQIISVGMEPIRRAATGRVHGPNPFSDRYETGAIEGPIPDVRVDVTGLDWVDDMRPRDEWEEYEVVPTRRYTSDESGAVAIDGLPAIPHRFDVSMPGFERVSKVLLPSEFEDFRFDLELYETSVSASVSSPYDAEGLSVRLERIPANGERMVRRVGAPVQQDDGTWAVTFDELVPGRYVVRAHHGGDAGGPQYNGPLFGTASNRSRWETHPGTATADVELNEKSAVSIDLEPRAALVTGTLFELFPDRNGVEPLPLERRLEQAGVEIEFVNDPAYVAMMPESRVVTTTTNARGEFTAEVPGGRWGLRIPGLTTHAAGWVDRVRMSDGWTRVSDNWPYAEPWPHATAPERAGGAMELESGEGYALDIWAARAVTGLFIEQDFKRTDVPTVLLDGVPAPDVGVVGPHRTQFVSSNSQVVVRDIMPGVHTIELLDPYRRCDPISFSVPDWPAPGVIPAEEGEWSHGPGFYYRAPLAEPPACPYKPEYQPTGKVTVYSQTYYPGIGEYSDPVEITPTIEGIPPDLPDGTLSVRSDRFPAAATLTNAYVTTSMGWVGPLDLTSGDEVTIYDGGQQHNIIPNDPYPFMAEAAVRAVTEEGTEVSLDVDVFGDGAVIVTTPNSGEDAPVVSLTSKPPYTPQLVSTDWGIVHQRFLWDDLAAKTGTITLIVERTITLEGQVTIAGEQPAAPLKLRAVTTGGAVRSLGETNPDGTFIVSAPATELYLEVDEIGFVPDQFAISPTSPDTVPVQLDLQPLAPPEVSRFTLNRHGSFLPHVLLSGNSGGFDPAGAVDSLTAIWKVEASPSDETHTHVRAEGDERPPTFGGNDAIKEVYLVDPRALDGLDVPARFLENRCRNSDSTCTVDMNCPGVDACGFLSHIDATTIAVLAGETPDAVFRGTRNADGSFTGKIPLWKLPAGPFSPFAVVVTELGAVRRLEYQVPDGKAPLIGVPISTWMGKILNLMGSVDNSGIGMNRPGSDAKFNPIPSFVPLAGFDGMIALVVSDDQPGMDPATDPDVMSHIVYDYAVTGTWSKKTKTPESGAIAMAAESMGFNVEARIRMLVEGDKQTRKLEARGALSVGYGREHKIGVSAVLIRLGKLGIPFPDIELEASMHGALAETARLDVEGDYDEFEMTTTWGGKLQAVTKFPIARILRVLGPVGTAVGETVQVLVEFYATTKNAVGGSLTETLLTVDADTGSTTIPRGDGPLRAAFPGEVFGIEPANLSAAKLTYFTGMGLGVSAFGGALDATGMIQLGGPDSIRDSVRLDLNPTLDWPLVTRARGAVSLSLRFQAKVAVIGYDKTFQKDLLGFDLQFGTEPFVDASPQEEVVTYATPRTADPAQFTGDDDVLVRGVYKGGDSAATADVVAWVSADKSEGVLELWAAPREGGEPQEVTSASGIVEVGIVERESGVVLVWSEIGPDAVGDVFATSTVYFATSSDGTNWSQPKEIGEASGLAIGFDGAALGDETVVVWGVPRGHALSNVLGYWGAVIDGDDVDPPELLFDEDTWINSSVDTVGDEIVVAAHRGSTDTTLERRWKNGAFGEPTDTGEMMRSAVYRPEGTFFSPVSGGIWFDPTGDPEPVRISSEAAGAKELEVVALEDGTLGVVWLETRESAGVWSVTVDQDGGFVSESRGIEAGPLVLINDLTVAADGTDVEAIVRTSKRTGVEIDVVAFPRDGEPSAPELADEGPSDDPTSIDGVLPTDDAAMGEDGEDGGSCLCAVHPTRMPWWTSLLPLALVVLRRRSRRSRQNVTRTHG